MHELSIARNILDKAQQLLQQYNAEKALAIYIKIGDLTSVEKESLEFCYGVLTGELEAFKECQLVVEQVPWIVRCTECSTLFNPDEHILKCPNCSSKNSLLVSGNELDFVSMEAE